MSATHDPRITELLDLVASEGIPLAITPETVCAIEDTGWVIDLVTGQMSRVEGLHLPLSYSLSLLGNALRPKERTVHIREVEDSMGGSADEAI
jgi:hypothetical protein